MFVEIASVPTEKVTGVEAGPVAAEQEQAPAVDLP